MQTVRHLSPLMWCSQGVPFAVPRDGHHPAPSRPQSCLRTEGRHRPQRAYAALFRSCIDVGTDALTVSDEELPNEEALVAQHSLASGQFGGKWTWKTWLLLILSVPALMFIYWLVGMLEAHLIVWLLS